MAKYLCRRVQPLLQTASPKLGFHFCGTPWKYSQDRKPVERSSSPPNRVVEEKKGGKVEEGTSHGEEEGNEGYVNKKIPEINGPKGLEPTRYGDWERNGRCYDF